LKYKAPADQSRERRQGYQAGPLTSYTTWLNDKEM